MEELGLQGAVHALVVLALRGNRQPVRGGVLHLEGSLQAVVIAQDICFAGGGGGRQNSNKAHNKRESRRQHTREDRL